MTSPNELTPWDLPPGRPIPSHVSYQNIRYPGEVISVPTWDPSLAEPLRGNCFFRIIFLQSHAPLSADEIKDSRIAVCIPPRLNPRGTQRAGIEQHVLREMKARYDIPETHQALIETQRHTYESGSIAARASLTLSTSTIFQGRSPEQWISTLARALLAWTYPDLPIAASAFQRPFMEDDAKRLFQGILAGDTSRESPPLFNTFGQGLGILPSDQASKSPNPVFQILQHGLESNQDTWSASDLYHWMGHVHGLPYPLISLYLLLYVRGSSPAVELVLQSDHGLRTAQGDAYGAQVIIPETVGDLAFEPRLDQKALLLRRSNPPSAEVFSLYFSALEPALSAVSEESAVHRLVEEALQKLQNEVTATEDGLASLAEALKANVPQGVLSVLRQLREVSQATAAGNALERVRQMYGAAANFADALAQFNSTKGVVNGRDFLQNAANYLEEAEAPEESVALFIQREGLLASLSMQELTTVSFSLEALEGQIGQFKVEYQRAYLLHHAQYYSQLASLLPLVHQARLHGQALQRLNSLNALGTPLGVENVDILSRLASGLILCNVPEQHIDLRTSPRCPNCGLSLNQPMQTQSITNICAQVEESLREKNRQLSHLLAQRILTDPLDERIERFIQVVHVSDLSGLANVLDDGLVAFIAEVLGSV